MANLNTKNKRKAKSNRNAKTITVLIELADLDYLSEFRAYGLKYKFHSGAYMGANYAVSGKLKNIINYLTSVYLIGGEYDLPSGLDYNGYITANLIK